MKTEKPKDLHGFVILGKRPSDNAYAAVIERSFSMDKSGDRVNIWFTGPAVSNFGSKHFLSTEMVRGAAEKHAKEFSHDGYEFVVWDIEDPTLPIEIDWAEYEEAGQPSDKSFSGVRDKFRRRNPTFKMRDDIPQAAE